MQMTFQQTMEVAITHLREGRVPDGIALLRQMLMIHPDHPGILIRLGMALHAIGQAGESLAMFEQMTRKHPRLPDGWNNMGVALQRMGRLQDAAAAFHKAIEVGGENADALTNLGGIFQELGNPGDAAAILQRAVEMNPNHVAARTNLAAALKFCGRVDEAIEAYQRALLVSPSDPQIHHYLGLTCLLKGDYARGWAEHEWRCQLKPPRAVCRVYPQPRWEGAQLNQKQVLIHTEQGLGDTIQFVRYLPLVQQRGGRVILHCQAELRELLQTVAGAQRVLSQFEPLSPFDLHCPLMSLPFVFKTTFQTVPAPGRYIHPDPHRTDRWRERVKHTPAGVKVGFVWAGKQSHADLRDRAIAPELLEPLAAIEGVRGFCLQKGTPVELQKPVALLGLTDWTMDLTDFAETAALMENLDLIVSVDTAVAHLAGAMGKPLLLMLPFIPDWRWGLAGEASPWYPTARLFRQQRAGEWGGVIAQVGQVLEEHIRSDRAKVRS